MSIVCRVFASMAFVALAASAAAADFPSLPNDSWYRVEIVIFERLAEDAANTQEILVSHAPRSFPLDAFAFDDDQSRTAAYSLDAETRALPPFPPVDIANRSAQAQTAALPVAQPTPAERAAKLIADYQAQMQERAFRFEPGALLLAQEGGRLQRSNVYRVVFHRAWIQPVPDRDQLRPMLIQVGERIGAGWRIEGFLGVTRGRYLHLDTRLWFTPNAAPDAQTTDPGYMELREQRRMRSGEMHYLDHPKFGVLARVDPVQPPDSLVTELARLAALPAQ